MPEGLRLYRLVKLTGWSKEALDEMSALELDELLEIDEILTSED